MSKNYAMSAAKREGTGKGIARALRRENQTPAVIYGDKKAPITIALPSKEINLEYNKGHMFTQLCELNVDGEQNLVLARDVQLHPVTDIVQHVDFLRVSAKTKIAVHVPVHFTDVEDSPGLEQKGTLNVTRHTVELFCAAINIPDRIDVSVAGKEHGDAVKISDAIMPDGTSPVITDRDFTIATILAPRTLEEEAADDAAAAAEGVEGEGVEGEEAAAEGGEEAAAEE